MQFYKKNQPFTLSILFSLVAFFSMLLPQMARADSSVPQGIGPVAGTATPDTSNAKIHGYYFYSNSCSHCIAILDEILTPLEQQYPGQLDIRLLELGNPDYYRALLAVEESFDVQAGDRDIPTVVIGDQILIGETQNRDNLKNILETGLVGEGMDFPTISGVDPQLMISVPPQPSTVETEVCSTANPEACQVDNPIYAAYFYQVGCKECNRADADIKYLQTMYPQLVLEEFNIYENTPLANWMAERTGREADLKVPALFIGEQAWIGEEEITSKNLEPVLKQLSTDGSEAFWRDFDPETGTNALVERFKSTGWLAIVVAGLVDGINPCAFATIIFFISYLTLSNKKGKEILITGAAFTIGVFVTYLLVGLGFYKVLDLVRNTLTIISKIVYGLTAAICLVLAFMSVKDYFKARKGQIEDMSLKLPDSLRKRINSTIREGRKASSYYLGAFVTGVLISLLELACTGQIYLPTIIFMTSVPELRGKSIGYLLLYNLMFIIPLIVVFILAYYGTTSKDLTNFFKKHTAIVKLCMAFVFIGLAIWLLVSLFS
ncbi:MAG: cytochrome c biogenesis protein CcdA [Anaerolineaceae bacterium]